MRQRWSDDGTERDGENTFVQDVQSNSSGAIAFLMVILLALISVPGKENVAGATIPGNILVEAYWPDDRDTDVDLWVMGPDKKPIGYSNKGGQYYNLLRDDLGRQSKDDPVNYELTTSRGIPVGWHCVNVHLYSNNSRQLPVPVKVTVKVQRDLPGSSGKGSDAPVLVSEVSLKMEGQELNVFCFKIDENGTYVPDKTIADQRVKLRSFEGFSPG